MSGLPRRLPTQRVQTLQVPTCARLRPSYDRLLPMFAMRRVCRLLCKSVTPRSPPFSITQWPSGHGSRHLRHRVAIQRNRRHIYLAYLARVSVHRLSAEIRREPLASHEAVRLVAAATEFEQGRASGSANSCGSRPSIGTPQSKHEPRRSTTGHPAHPARTACGARPATPPRSIAL